MKNVPQKFRRGGDGGEFFNIQCLSLPHVKIGNKFFSLQLYLIVLFLQEWMLKERVGEQRSGKKKKREREGGNGKERERERESRAKERHTCCIKTHYK